MFTRFTFASAILALGVGVLANGGPQISSQCQATLVNIAGSSEAQCLNVAGLAPLLTTPQDQSVVGPINTWLSGFCAQEPCTNQTLSNIVTNITTGCASDIASIGLQNVSTSEVISAVQQGYPIVRKIACLRQTSNNTLCLTTLLTEIEQATGKTLSVSNLHSEVPKWTSGGGQQVPPYIACSDCVKAAYNIIKQDAPAIASSTQLTGPLTSQCGANFIDGSSVTSVVEGTASSVPSGNQAAADSAAVVSRGVLTGFTVSGLALVSSAFLMLA